VSAAALSVSGRGKSYYRSKSQGRQLSTIAALAMTGLIYKLHYCEAIRGPQVVRILRRLRFCFGRLLIVIWDQPQPIARVVKERLATERGISVEWLPPYAPELNPEGYCHSNVKEQIRNTTPE